jgi:hypothetical protein
VQSPPPPPRAAIIVAAVAAILVQFIKSGSRGLCVASAGRNVRQRPFGVPRPTTAPRHHVRSAEPGCKPQAEEPARSDMWYIGAFLAGPEPPTHRDASGLCGGNGWDFGSRSSPERLPAFCRPDENWEPIGRHKLTDLPPLDPLWYRSRLSQDLCAGFVNFRSEELSRAKPRLRGEGRGEGPYSTAERAVSIRSRSRAGTLPRAR